MIAMRLLRACLLIACLLVPRLSVTQETNSATLASRIDKIMQTRHGSGEFNGTVLVARRGKIVYAHAFGLANREWNVATDLQTKFEIGSMTKQFTAMLVLQFVNEGKLRLDGRVSEYLPYYRPDTGQRITISELLSHTSGIPNFISAPGFLDGPASRVHSSVQEFVQKYCSDELRFAPGSKFEYSNSGYFLLGAILEQVSGQSYETLLQERIFQPLGMKDSGYAHSDAIIDHRAAGYERTSSGLRNARYYDMSIPYAAGALYSTVEDLFLWDQALYGERLLPPGLRDLLFKPNLESYGYGWGLLVPKTGSPYAGESIPMHGGAIFGFQSVIERIVQHGEVIVLLDNTDSPKLLEIAVNIRQVLAENP